MFVKFLAKYVKFIVAFTILGIVGVLAYRMISARFDTLEQRLSQLRDVQRETLFEDNFENRTQMEEQNEWIFPSGGTWVISTLGSRVLEQADRNAPNSAAPVGHKDWSRYVVQVELRIEHSGDAGVFAYWNTSQENYRLRTSDFLSKLQTAKLVPIGQGQHGNIYLNEKTLHLEDSRWYVFQFEVTAHDTYTYLRGKVWPMGETEPGTWVLEASDHAPERYQSGQAGVWTIKSGASYRCVKFDNFQVFRITRVY